MKRMAITLAQVAARDNLLLAVHKAAKAKRQRPSVARFLSHLDANLNQLAQSILDGSAPVGQGYQFEILDPKRRTITAACFADRVLHHAILNLAEPRFEQMLVPSTYACRPGRGVHAAVAAVQRHLQRYTWVVQVDVAGYFPSIDHARLKALLARRFKGAPFLALLGRIVDLGATGTEAKGLPIGSLTSQHFANAYLDAADRFLLEHPAVRAHARYMDDILWCCDSLADAQATLRELTSFMRDELGLTIKPGAHVGLASRGVRFCGFRVKPGVVLASARKLARYRAHTRGIDAALDAGFCTEAQAQRAVETAHAALAHTASEGFRRQLWVTRGNGIAAKKLGTGIFRAMQQPTARRMSIPEFFVGADSECHKEKAQGFHQRVDSGGLCSQFLQRRNLRLRIPVQLQTQTQSATCGDSWQSATCGDSWQSALRGGSWNNNAQNARSAYRNARHRDNRNNNAGFRFALSSRVAARVWIHGKGSLTMDQTGAPWCGVKQFVMPYPNRKAAGVLVGKQQLHRKLPGKPTFGIRRCLKNGYYG